MASVRGILKAVTHHQGSVNSRITVLMTFAVFTVAADPTSPANASAATLRYHCGFPVIGLQPTVATVEWNTPPVIQVGQPVQSLALSMQATIPPLAVVELHLLTVASFDGTADMSSDIHAPQGDTPEKVTLNVARSKVPPSGSMAVSAAGNTPVVTFTQAGQGQFNAGAITMHLKGYAANGSPGSPFDVKCTLDSGQSGVVATFNIAVAASPSNAPSSSTTQVPPPPVGGLPHPPTPSSASVPASQSTGTTGLTSDKTSSSVSSAGAIASVSTSDTGAASSGVSTDPSPALAAAAQASTAESPAFASASTPVDRGAAVTDWLLVACALLVTGGAGVFGASRLKKRRERAAQPTAR